MVHPAAVAIAQSLPVAYHLGGDSASAVPRPTGRNTDSLPGLQQVRRSKKTYGVCWKLRQSGANGPLSWIFLLRRSPPLRKSAVNEESPVLTTKDTMRPSTGSDHAVVAGMNACDLGRLVPQSERDWPAVDSCIPVSVRR